MSLSKSWKILPLVAMLAVAFTGCAGSKGSSSEGGSEVGSSTESGTGSEGSVNAEGKPAAPKEDIDSDKLKKAQDDAMSAENENHELRRQIFDAKNKLGMPVEQSEE